MTADDSQWLDVAVAARALRCGRDTILRLVRRGKLRARNRGLGTVPRYEVARSDVAALRRGQEADVFHVQQPSESRRPRET